MRQEGDAHAGHHRLLERLVAAELVRGQRLDAVRAQEALEVVACARALFAQQQALFGQRRGRDALAPGQAVVRPCDEGQPVRRERDAAQVEAAWRLAHDRDVAALLLQQRAHVLAVGDREPERDVREAAAEFGEQIGHEILRGGDRHHVQRARRHPDARLQLDLGQLQSVQGLARRPHQDLARRGEADLAPAIDQHLADDGLGIADLHRDRRLGQVQQARGLGEARAVGHRHQGAELLEGHALRQLHQETLSQIGIKRHLSLFKHRLINPALKYIHCAAYAAAGCWK